MSESAIDFHRPIPLFPLPNIVLFPGVVQPLHIFEERYKRMMAATLNDQAAIAMVLLQDGWEKDYHGAPAIHDTACVGQIIAHEQRDDGTYNLLLRGVARARLDRERRHDGYRIAHLVHLFDHPVNPLADAQHRTAIADLFSAGTLATLPVAATIRELLAAAVTLSALVDMLAFTLLQDLAVKQRLLEELDTCVRAELVIDQLRTLARNAIHTAPTTRPLGDQWPPPVNPN